MHPPPQVAGSISPSQAQSASKIVQFVTMHTTQRMIGIAITTQPCNNGGAGADTNRYEPSTRRDKGCRARLRNFVMQIADSQLRGALDKEGSARSGRHSRRYRSPSSTSGRHPGRRRCIWTTTRARRRRPGSSRRARSQGRRRSPRRRTRRSTRAGPSSPRPCTAPRTWPGPRPGASQTGRCSTRRHLGGEGGQRHFNFMLFIHVPVPCPRSLAIEARGSDEGSKTQHARNHRLPVN